MPTEEVAKVPVAPAVFSVIVSPFTIPARAALLVFNVAAMFPSYVLSFAVMPVIVRLLLVMLAEVVGCVSV